MKKFCKGLLAIVLVSNLSLPLWAASNSTKFPGAGNNRYSAAIQLVPDSTTDLLTTNTDIYQITVANITGSACTLTVTDKQSTPRYILAAVSIAANTTYVIAWPEGVFMSSGVAWSSGTASCLQAQVKALYK